MSQSLLRVHNTVTHEWDRIIFFFFGFIGLITAHASSSIPNTLLFRRRLYPDFTSYNTFVLVFRRQASVSENPVHASVCRSSTAWPKRTSLDARGHAASGRRVSDGNRPIEVFGSGDYYTRNNTTARRHRWARNDNSVGYGFRRKTRTFTHGAGRARTNRRRQLATQCTTISDAAYDNRARQSSDQGRWLYRPVCNGRTRK